jgi:hypothetical protein
MVASIVNVWQKKSNVGSMRKLSEFYIIELVDSNFHLCGCGHDHDRVDVDALVADITDVDNDPMALYLGYYDWSSSRRLYVTDSRVIHIS